jgi:signal transduction histidine kinase
MPKRALAEDLAEAQVRALAGQRRAGRVLHDDIGPLLSAAGLRLQLLRMDFPDAADRAREVMEVLDEAMERVRELSQALNPSPVYRSGFKNALAGLIEARQRKFPGRIQFNFASTARLPVEAALAMYEAAAVALDDAVEHADATRIVVSVRGSGQVTLRVSDNGRGKRSHRALAIASLLARHAGLTFEVSTGKGTIVGIQYALRRPSRG